VFIRDLHIRKALHRTLLLGHKSLPEKTIIIDEFDVCSNVRADIAIINGSLSGIEIKSEADTLKRLPQQSYYYGKVFDYLTLVTSEKHIHHLTLPEFWGIQVVTSSGNKVVIQELQKPQQNDGIDSTFLVQLLWKEEAIELLRKFDALRGLKSKPRREIWAKIAMVVDRDSLREYVRNAIKQRKGWLSDRRPVICGG
jgi:hypothetical protein